MTATRARFLLAATLAAALVSTPSSGAASAPGSEEEGPLARREREKRAALAEAGLERGVLETEAGRLVYWHGGEGEPIALLHGSGDSAGAWAAVVPALIGGHRLVVPDLAGHGESEPTEGVLPMATILAGLEALLEEVAVDSPILVGNSMGAWLAMLYAHRHPGRVVRVVTVNGGAILGEPSELTLMPADRAQARRLMAALRDPSSPAVPDDVLDDIVRRSRKGPIGRMMLDLPGMMGHLLDARLGEIETPIDLLWGESDGLMKVRYAVKMAAGLPRARITLIPRCGHIPMSECPERFVGLLVETLAREPPEQTTPSAADEGG